MEPRTSTSIARLRAIEQLTSAGIPTHVMVAPIIPGLNETEIPAILQQASKAGAKASGYILLRLPLTVRQVFIDWLHKAFPLKAQRVLSRIQSTRDGRLNSSNFRERMRGQGEMANQIKQSFELFSRKYGLDKRLPILDTKRFRRPAKDPTTYGRRDRQQMLF